ncbi:cyclase family protein [Oxynema aestuarii]|uniref:Cyclase family protein n=1 Tax=Oxynema aestuarii AP17 TaxID=2064643 RepID=A0A6H1TVW1_9CYAN|nr:cyclase family protein [Oxynema aestuarii]QIZ70585.1 cyclase family protein [Oxynema aestuarii AP17]RMH75846.1 MAG: cyclase family protein [Cyanobacteria bacterium J007]
MKQIVYSQVIHLSHPIHPEIPRWPGDPPVEFEAIAQLPEDGYYLRRFSMGEHSATHINAPNSFYTDGVGIDAYAAESLILPAVVLDWRDRAIAHPDSVVEIADILAWEALHGAIAPGSVVLLYTGWQQRWASGEQFINDRHFPGFAAETSQFLLERRQIGGVGTDTHGVDPGQDDRFATNRQILAKQGIVLENLANLDRLPPTGTTLAIGILRLQKGSGSPAAVFAFIP